MVGNLFLMDLGSWWFIRFIFCKDFYEDPSCGETMRVHLSMWNSGLNIDQLVHKGCCFLFGHSN
jgi:hypothetical protein